MTLPLTFQVTLGAGVPLTLHSSKNSAAPSSTDCTLLSKSKAIGSITLISKSLRSCCPSISASQAYLPPSPADRPRKTRLRPPCESPWLRST